MRCDVSRVSRHQSGFMGVQGELLGAPPESTAALHYRALKPGALTVQPHGLYEGREPETPPDTH